MKKMLLILLTAASSLLALDVNDDKAIHQIVEHFTNAWNEHEGHGSADYYAENADFVNIFGMVFSGKEEIEARHVKIHEAFLKGSTFEVAEIKLREAKPDVVIAHVHWKVSFPENEPMKGVFTHVFLKTNDKWEITASQNTLLKTGA